MKNRYFDACMKLYGMNSNESQKPNESERIISVRIRSLIGMQEEFMWNFKWRFFSLVKANILISAFLVPDPVCMRGWR